MSFFQVIAFVAFSTSTVLSVSFALIGDGNTDSINVEDIEVRAPEADLVIPIPDATSRVRGLGEVRFREVT